MATRPARTAPTLPLTPTTGGFETLHSALRALWSDPQLQRTVNRVGGVNSALRDLLDRHPELELLPLELLAAELMPVAGGRTPWRTCI